MGDEMKEGSGSQGKLGSIERAQYPLDGKTTGCWLHGNSVLTRHAGIVFVFAVPTWPPNPTFFWMPSRWRGTQGDPRMKFLLRCSMHEQAQGYAKVPGRGSGGGMGYVRTLT